MLTTLDLIVPLLAQATVPAPAANAPASAVSDPSLWDFVLKGGPMMFPIGLCSAIALGVFVERLLSLRRRRVIPPDFLPGLKKLLDDSPTDRAGMTAYCQSKPSPVANVFAAGIKRLGAPAEHVEKHILDAGEREVLKLRRNVRVLSVIASIAPLMGLLGTIFGMIRAFQTVAASAEALGKTELLAAGIYEAMVTTAAGLLVAIPVLVFYHWISSRIERLVMEIDHLTVDFIEEYAAPMSADRPRHARPAPRGGAGSIAMSDGHRDTTELAVASAAST